MITREADYALRALLLLIDNKHKNTVVTTLVLSEEMDIPYRFLRKILKKLRNGGFIETKKGKTGGIQLKKKETDISVLDVLYTVSKNSVELNSCISGDCDCSRIEFCKLHKELGDLQSRINMTLKNMTLDKLV